MSSSDPVPSYVLTGGRFRPSRNTIRPETLLVATETIAPVSATRAHRDLLAVCRGVLSLAEAAAHLDMTVSVLLVIASDLVDSGHLALRGGPVEDSSGSLGLPRFEVPDQSVLEAVLDGLRAL